jgi:hypothetical protein
MCNTLERESGVGTGRWERGEVMNEEEKALLISVKHLQATQREERLRCSMTGEGGLKRPQNKFRNAEVFFTQELF